MLSPGSTTLQRGFEASASARVSAAKTLLDTAFKVVELSDLKERFAALEAELKVPARSEL